MEFAGAVMVPAMCLSEIVIIPVMYPEHFPIQPIRVLTPDEFAEKALVPLKIATTQVKSTLSTVREEFAARPWVPGQ